MASFLNAADRKRMEQERLARLGLDKTEPSDNQKRRREDSGSSSAQDSLKKPKVSEVIDLCSDSDDDIEVSESSISSRYVRTNLKFRDGLVGLTAAAFSDRTDRIKFKDLIDANHLRRALLSSFVWEDDWLFQHVPADIPICLVRTEPFSLEPVPSNIKIVNPPMLQNRGCMHVKLLVLFFDEYVRIVITSANLIAIHWDNGMENVVFVQDFPRYDGPITSPISSQFQLHLIQFLTALTVPSQVMDRLKEFDFSQAQAKLVASKPGSTFYPNPSQSSMSSDVTRFPDITYGQFALQLAVDQLKVTTLEKSTRVPHLYAVTSSMGALTDDWILSFYLSSCGASTSEVESTVRSTTDPMKEVRGRMHVLFPTKKEVRSSVIPEFGGSICFNRKYFESPKFPKDVLYQLKSKQAGMLMHTKLIIAKWEEEIVSHNSLLGWYYCGSHNFSSSAWGTVKLPKGKSKSRPSVFMSNWELGVILPITKGDLNKKLPVPFQEPVIPMGNGSRENTPFFQAENMDLFME